MHHFHTCHLQYMRFKGAVYTEEYDDFLMERKKKKKTKTETLQNINYCCTALRYSYSVALAKVLEIIETLTFVVH